MMCCASVATGENKKCASFVAANNERIAVWRTQKPKLGKHKTQTQKTALSIRAKKSALRKALAKHFSNAECKTVNDSQTTPKSAPSFQCKPRCKLLLAAFTCKRNTKRRQKLELVLFFVLLCFVRILFALLLLVSSLLQRSTRDELRLFSAKVSLAGRQTSGQICLARRNHNSELALRALRCLLAEQFALLCCELASGECYNCSKPLDIPSSEQSMRRLSNNCLLAQVKGSRQLAESHSRLLLAALVCNAANLAV